MTSAEKISVSRIGEKIPIPEFWSTLLVEWNNSTGYTYQEALEALNKFHPYIIYAHQNYKLEAHVLPNDANFVGGDQAGLNPTTALPNAHINLDPAWDISVGSPTCKVGVYDGGINWDHEDLMFGAGFANSAVIGGWDFIKNNSPSTDTEHDEDGHGSAVAGIIAAKRNNAIGGAGIAGGNAETRGVQLFSMKVLGLTNTKTVGQWTVVANAIAEGATSPQQNGFGYGLHIMNNSYGSECLPEQNCITRSVLYDAVKFAFENNVVFVASAGNGGSELKGVSLPNYPGSFNDDWVLKTGASDNNGERLGISSIGNNIDFIAPGGKGLSASIVHNNNADYNLGFGATSGAAPHVAGVAALMLSYMQNQTKKPNDLANEDVEQLLQIYATDKGTQDYDDETGFGLINAGATLQGILLPRFEVKHFNNKYTAKNSTLIENNRKINLPFPTGNLPPGTYFANVWRIDFEVDITQPIGRNVLDVWVRNASSDGLPNSTLFENETDIKIVSWNQKKVVLSCFVYKVLTDITTLKSINKWFPSSELSGRIAITVYSEKANLTSEDNIPINADLVNIIPNPSSGNFRLSFGFLKNTNLAVQVTDVSGKVVYYEPKRRESEGHKDISLDLSELSQGLYFCNLITDEGVITKKITIIR